MQTAYSNVRVFTGKSVEINKAILVKEGIIEGLVNSSEIPSSYTVEDLQGNNIAPSLIDLQIYGGNGKMFSQETKITNC